MVGGGRRTWVTTKGGSRTVTGAARGIGAATVQRLCDEGYHVVALDACLGDAPTQPDGVSYPLATRADLDAVVARRPDRITAAVCDVRETPAPVRAVVADTLARHGRLDAAVAAAAVIAGGAPQWETPADELRTLLDIDVVGVWNTAAATIPAMLGGTSPQDCRFVAIACRRRRAGPVPAQRLLRGQACGHRSRAGPGGRPRRHGRRSRGRLPRGSTATSMLEATAAIYDVAHVDELAASQLIRRTLSPEELAATIAFCCSPEAASLNGSVVSATGGFVG